jgi:hypothetical protein
MDQALLSDADVFGGSPAQAIAQANATGQPVMIGSTPNRSVTMEVLPHDPAPAPAPAEAAAPQPSAQPSLMSDADVFGAHGAPAADATPPASHIDEGLGLYKGAIHVWDNAAQALEYGARKIGLPVDALNQWGASVGMAPSSANAAAQHDAYIADQAAHGVQPGKIGEFGGGVLATIPALAGLGPLAGGALGGALQTNSKTPGGVAMDAGFGAAGGKIGDMALGGLKNLIAPKVSEAVQALLDAKVPLTPGQIAGGGLKRIEDDLTSIPVLGDIINNAKARGMTGFNTAAINRSLDPIGDALPVNLPSGNAAIDYAHDALGKAYDAALNGVTATQDPVYAANMKNLKSLATNLGGDYAQRFANLMSREVESRFAPQTGVASGDGLKAMESQLGSEASRAGRLPDLNAQDYANAVRQAQAEVRGLVARTNPEVAQRVGAINSGYANLVRVENAGARVGSDGGEFTPAQLHGAVRAGDNSVRKADFARGNALMQDLSTAGKSVLPSAVPDSGSPLRHALEGLVAVLVGSEAHVLPLLMKGAAGATVLGSAYTKAGQKVITPMMTERPAWAPQAADQLEKLRALVQTGGAIALPQAARTALPAQ